MVCYYTAGTYDVIQIVSNSFGTDTLVKTNLVTITPTPVPNFVSTDQNLCAGDCIDYTDQTVGIVQTYVWTFQGGTPLNSSDLNPANVCYNVAGFFNTTLTVTNGTCTNSNTHVGYINVSQPTPPTISMSGDTLLSSPAMTYQWYQVGVGPLPAGIFQYIVATAGQAYYVCITDAAGCSACSDTFLYNPEGVHDVDLSQSFQVYPNPVFSELSISNTSGISKSTVQILDATGRLVKDQTVKFVNGKAEVSVGEIAKGTYMLQLLDDRQQVIFSTPLVKN
jgi:PKD repeat protein